MQVETGQRKIGIQLAEYINEMMGQLREETEEQIRETAARIYAKAESGKKLTVDEKNYLARNNEALYAKVMRAEAMRSNLESQLKSCQTKEEAYEVYSAAYHSISKDDPDRELLLNTINEVWREVCESDAYKRMKEHDETKLRYRMTVSETGYQELYVAAGSGDGIDSYS